MPRVHRRSRRGSSGSRATVRDPFAAGDKLVLMGLDTEDGKGERVILGKRQSYVKPLLTPTWRSHRVLDAARRRPAGSLRGQLGWRGPEAARQGLRADGVAEPGRQHASGSTSAPTTKATTSPQSRASPSTIPRSANWSGTRRPVSGDTFQVSADGRSPPASFRGRMRASRSCRTSRWKKLGDGCWTAMTTRAARCPGISTARIAT